MAGRSCERSTESSEVLSEVLKQPPNVVRSLPVNSQESNEPEANIDAIIDINRFGNFNKLLRVTAHVMKFINKLKQSRELRKQGRERSRNKESNSLLASEIEQAELMWITCIQKASFKTELEFLGRKTNRSMPQYVSQFGLYLDNNRVLRCKGRLDKSGMEFGTRHPVLLPPKHPFVELIIRDVHERVKHNGIRDTLTTIRERFWIIRGRESVKRLIKGCVICRKAEGQPYTCGSVPDLPAMRVSSDPPFTNVGLDFAGPLYIRDKGNDRDENSGKVYILLFTCASTRAVHLEVTPTLSVPSFLRAFRRFVSRRGTPALLISDNAKTFRAASKEIRLLCRAEEVWRYLANQKITWNFIVEKAPWWGGFWERLVKSIKRPLKKIIGRTSLTYDQLQTIVVEIEGLLNARPLTYIYDDVESISFPLTPSHLIYGRRIVNLPNAQHSEIISTNKSLTRRLRHHRYLLEKFANHWKREYLQSLREQSNTKARTDNESGIAIGDIVIVRNEKTNRNFWKLAKVEDLLQGGDKVVRAAVIRICVENSNRTQLLRRPLRHLFPIEVRSSDQEDNEVPRKVTKDDEDKEILPRSTRPKRQAAITGQLRRLEQSGKL